MASPIDAAASTAGGSSVTPPSVLIIEDSPTDARYLSVIAYQELGAVVRWFEDGIDGLREALSSPPDLLLLDLGLPRLRGEEICRILRSAPAGNNLPIIIISGMSDTKQRELEMLGLGANAYFSKPINPKELVQAINTALNTRFIGQQLDDTLLKSPVPEGRKKRARVEPSSLELAAGETQEAIQPFGEFGDFSLKGIIGAGGFGTVYRAVQKSLNRNVAIKVLLSEAASDRQLRERFRREAMTMARLNHPNIVQIFDMGEREHTIYIVMELVEGVSLWDAILEEGGDPFPEEVTRLVVDQLCTAVAYMHSQGVVHRDIKPRNVLVGMNGAVKLGDFGISRTNGAPSLTQVHQVIGTPFYISPEVAHGEVATPQSDIYSLGLTLWTMLAGNIEAIPGETSLAARGAHVSPEFSAALEKCYAPNPADRYTSAEIARLALLAAMS